MTLEEKLSHLQASAMEEARGQGNAIIRQHEDSLNRVFDQHCAEASKQSETRIKAETTTARQQLNMATSKAQLELKRELGKIHDELKKNLFLEVIQLVNEYMQTEEYKRLLVAHIEKAVKFANGESMTIYINPSDTDKKEYLEEHTGMALTISREDFIGGVRAVVTDRNILIDHAFKGAIDSEYQKFLFKGGAGIE